MSIDKTTSVSILAGKPATEKSKRGPAKGQGGRKPGPEKVRLSLRVLPETRDFLGDDPSAALDRLCKVELEKGG